MVAKKSKVKYKVTAAMVATIIIALLGIPVVVLAYMLDFTGELLMCAAVAFGGIGEWVTAKRHLQPMLKAVFGALIIVGAIVLIFGYGKTSLILMMLTQFPFYIALFFTMCGIWVIIKHRHEAVYGFLTILLAAIVLVVYGMGVGVGWEFYAVIAIIIIGVIIARQKQVSFDVIRRGKKK